MKIREFNCRGSNTSASMIKSPAKYKSDGNSTIPSPDRVVAAPFSHRFHCFFFFPPKMNAAFPAPFQMLSTLFAGRFLISESNCFFFLFFSFLFLWFLFHQTSLRCCFALPTPVPCCSHFFSTIIISQGRFSSWSGLGVPNGVVLVVQIKLSSMEFSVAWQ